MIYHGDALETLRGMPDNYYHCVVTSPPYWRQREYGHEGQLGQEPVFDCRIVPNIVDNKIVLCGECYICRLVEVFREVRRVLRKDGVFILNVGDGYVGSEKQQTNKGTNNIPKSIVPSGLKPKDMLALPYRVILALQSDGWWFRADIPTEIEYMCPCGCGHEMVVQKVTDNSIVWRKDNCMPESVNDRPSKSHEYIFLLSASQRYFYDAEAIAEPMLHKGKNLPPIGGIKHKEYGDNPTYSGNTPPTKKTKNIRSVWRIPVQASHEDHKAMFPEELARRCIGAGTSLKGCCSECGTPWKRVYIELEHDHKREPAHVPGNTSTKVDSTGWTSTMQATDEFEPGCNCAADVVPCRVLDPFGGSGTTIRVAKAMGREGDMIEISEKSVKIARRRENMPFGRSRTKLIDNEDQIGMDL